MSCQRALRKSLWQPQCPGHHQPAFGARSVGLSMCPVSSLYPRSTRLRSSRLHLGVKFNIAKVHKSVPEPEPSNRGVISNKRNWLVNYPPGPRPRKGGPGTRMIFAQPCMAMPRQYDCCRSDPPPVSGLRTLQAPKANFGSGCRSATVKNRAAGT